MRWAVLFLDHTPSRNLRRPGHKPRTVPIEVLHLFLYQAMESETDSSPIGSPPHRLDRGEAPVVASFDLNCVDLGQTAHAGSTVG